MVRGVAEVNIASVTGAVEGKLGPVKVSFELEGSVGYGGKIEAGVDLKKMKATGGVKLIPGLEGGFKIVIQIEE